MEINKHCMQLLVNANWMPKMSWSSLSTLLSSNVYRVVWISWNILSLYTQYSQIFGLNEEEKILDIKSVQSYSGLKLTRNFFGTDA